MAENLWWNKYVGVQFLAKGRELATGVDCWGLARKVYEQEFGINLPSFSDEYDAGRPMMIAEAIAKYKEGWKLADIPKSGDMVLFRVEGAESHVGVVTRPGFFLHVRENQTATVERLDSAIWKNRVVGIFQYIEASTDLDVVALPHPLKTVRVDVKLASGFSLLELAQEIRKDNSISEEFNSDAVISVDGAYIPRDLWNVTIPAAGARVEYRATLQKGAIKSLMVMVAVLVFQQYYLAPLLGAAVTAGTMTAVTAGIISGVAGMALNMVGNMLMNAIFPIRPPSMGGSGDASGIRPMNMLSGGNNQPNRYGSIPVVLGAFKFTPPVGAVNYVETTGSKSFLNQLVVWGYGPLLVTNLTVGETPINTYDEVQVATINGWQDSQAEYVLFNSLYGKDVEQIAVNQKLVQVDGWLYRTMSTASDRLNVTIDFPQGLFGVNPEAVAPIAKQAIVSVQYRKVGEANWNAVQEAIPAQSFALPSPYITNTTTIAYGPQGVVSQVYGLVRVSLNKYNQVIVRTGSFAWDLALTQHAKPTSDGIIGIYGITPFEPYPVLGAGEAHIYDIKMYGGTVVSVTDYRALQTIGTITGAALTATSATTVPGVWGTVGPKAAITSGVIVRVLVESLNIIRATKIAFSENITFWVPNGIYEVRAMRANDNGGVTALAYDDTVFSTLTGYSNQRPISFPKPLAMTAVRVKATNQLSGNMEGLTAVVQSVCQDYDQPTNTWVFRPTSNPASLLRYVLQHPANAKPVPDSGVNLETLADWHNFCRVEGFTFNHVMTGQQSVFDVLKDIAAAGRASPTLVDGMWTVIIDRPRSEIAQHFTPHNSWGFEGARTLPIIPDAFRVSFINSDKGYLPDERIVYNDGKNAANAVTFEGLSLPGVTHADIIYKQARFHMAQVKLRPETYTLNSDIEHLVCTRGDLVKVTHDVPMWGVGSGRISERVSNTAVEIDEEFPMEAGVSYAIRIRKANGGSVVFNLEPATVDGLYSILNLTTAAAELDTEVGNLILFGLLGSESVELIVQSVEPAANMTARLTLVDYAPAVYESDNEAIPAFDSQITGFPELTMGKIFSAPIISRVASDESVMEVTSPGNYVYNIRVSYTKPATLPQGVSHVEGEIGVTGGTDGYWDSTLLVSSETGSISFPNVVEQAEYKFRLRFVDAVGNTGPWTETTLHTVVGRTTPPNDVLGFTAAVDGQKIILVWQANTEIDLDSYEVRSADSGWGDANYLFKGKTSAALVLPGAVNVSKTWYVKAVDTIGLYSSIASSVNYTVLPPSAPLILTAAFADTSLTAATITLDWSEVLPTFGLSHYEVSDGTDVKTVNATTITLPANWIGDKTFTVKTVDLLTNISAAKSLVVPKLLPVAVTTASAEPQTSGSMLIDWPDAIKSTLPVWGYEVRMADTGWGTPGAIFKGTASAFTLPSSLLSVGTNNLYIKTIDTDDNLSATFTLTFATTVPGVVTLAATIVGADYKLSMTVPASTFPLAYYEIRSGAEWATGVYVGSSVGQTFQAPVDFGGEKMFLVAAVDILGNVGDVNAVSIVITPALAPMVTTQVIDNNVLLYWNDTQQSLPISTYELRKGSVFASAEVIGTKSGLFTNLFETQAGVFTYWVVAIDTAGNYGTPSSISAVMSQPPDYVLKADYDSVLDGTLSNAVLDKYGVNMPINTTETIQQHFDNNGWATPQAQVAAGFPLWIEPTVAGGYYEEFIDYGITLAACKVTAAPTILIVTGAPVITYTVSLSADNATWVDYVGTTEVFGTAFRYVKVRCAVASSGGDDLITLAGLNIRLDVKLKNDAGSVAAVSSDNSAAIVGAGVGGTTVLFNSSFSNITSITVTPQGTTPVTAVYDFIGSTINPIGFKIYMYNSAGARISGTVSWSAKGY